MEAYRRIHATLGERVVVPPADIPRNGRRDSRLAAPVARSTGRRSRFPSLDRPRPAGPVLTATAVIALLALLALAVGRLAVGSSAPKPSRAAGRTAATATTAAARAASAPGRSHSRAGPRAGATATTAPAANVIAPRSVTAAGADYVVPTASFSVQLDTAGGACWVEVGPSAAGPFSFVGTIPSGVQRVFPGSSRLWIRLGAPGTVTVTVNGTPLQLTAPGSAPYDLTISAVGA